MMQQKSCSFPKMQHFAAAADSFDRFSSAAVATASPVTKNNAKKSTFGGPGARPIVLAACFVILGLGRSKSKQKTKFYNKNKFHFISSQSPWLWEEKQA